MPKFSSAVKVITITKPIVLIADDEEDFTAKVRDLDEKDLIHYSDSVTIGLDDDDGEGTEVKQVSKSTKVTEFPPADEK